MYWKVRKLSLKDMALKNWVYVALVFSVMGNMLGIAMRPSVGKGMTGELKLNYDQFARQVTSHLLDTSYITYKASTIALGGPQLQGGGELEKHVLEGMKQTGLMAKSSEEVEALGKGLYDTRTVAAVRIDGVNIGTPPANKPVPVDVSGVVVIHSSQETNPNPVPFDFHFDMALKPGENGQAAVGPDGKPLPMVVGFKENQTAK
jgi:hypothetical protein